MAVPLPDAQEGDRSLQGAGLEPARRHAGGDPRDARGKVLFLFRKLRVDGSRALVSRYVQPVPVPFRRGGRGGRAPASCATTRPGMTERGRRRRPKARKTTPEASRLRSRASVPQMTAVVKTKPRRGRRPRRSGGPRTEARTGRGPHPRPRDGDLRLRQAHLPVGPLDGRHVQAAPHLRPRVLRRDRRVRPGRQAAAPRRGPVRLGRDARHLRRLPAVPDGPPPHLREHEDPRRPRRRMLRPVRRRAGLQRRGARPRDDPAEGRRLPRRARQRRPHDPGRGPLGQVRGRARLRADRRDVRRDRPDLRRRADRDHGGQRLAAAHARRWAKARGSRRSR